MPFVNAVIRVSLCVHSVRVFYSSLTLFSIISGVAMQVTEFSPKLDSIFFKYTVKRVDIFFVLFMLVLVLILVIYCNRV